MSESIRISSANEHGWKPIPLALKIIFVLLLLWVVGTVMNLPNLFENGMPLFGTFVFGVNAMILPLLLDFIGPIVLLFALWTRKSWAVIWALAYNGLFILNNIIALFTVREELGIAPILVPTLVSLIILAIVFWQRDYFKN